MYIHKINSKFKMYDSTNTFLRDPMKNKTIFHGSLTPYKTSITGPLLLLSFFFAYAWK